MRTAARPGVAALVALLLLPGGAVAQEGSPAPEIKGADPALLQTVQSIAGRVAALVGAKAPPPMIAVRADAPSRDAAARARALTFLTRETLAARGRAWADLGLGTARDPEDLVVALARDLDGMGFDRDGARVLVDPDRLREDTGKGDPSADAAASLLLATGLAPDEPVLAHYAAHALLDSGIPPAGVTTDALLARSALSEGAANAAALVLLFGGMGLESEAVSGAIRPEDALGGRLVPAALRSSTPAVGSFLEFVYLDGFAQAASLLRAGDFGRLALERGRRPTTRDVLHLDRAPSARVEPDLPRLPAGSSLVVADRDSLGEQGIITLVSKGTGKDNLGLIAGDGWAGDALWRLEPPGKPEEGVTLWIVRFGTEEDAKDMAYALGRCLSSRFPGAAVAGTPDGGGVLTAGGKVYRIARNGIEVSFRVGGIAEDLRFEGGPVKKAAPPRSAVPPPKKK